jgi:hypothetical protein
MHGFKWNCIYLKTAGQELGAILQNFNPAEGEEMQVPAGRCSESQAGGKLAHRTGGQTANGTHHEFTRFLYLKMRI